MAKRKKPEVQGNTANALPAITRSNEPPPDPTFFQTLRMITKKDPFTRPYSQHVWIYACNQAIATAIASVPFRLYKRSAADGMKRTAGARKDALKRELPNANDDAIELISMLEDPMSRYREVSRLAPWLPPARMIRAVGEMGLVQSGPWFELFRDVNPIMTKSQLWEATIIQLGLGGECFWVLESKSDAPIGPTEVPYEIWPYGRKGWKPKINPESMLPEQWIYEYTINGKRVTKTLDLHQVIRANYFDPHNSVRGVAPFDAVRSELEADWKAQLFNQSFFDNGASPGGYLFSEKPLTPSQRKALLEEWEERHTGARKANRPDVLAGIKFVESNTTHRDMQFSELRDKVRDAVLAAYRTPRSVLGLNEDVNRASSVVGRRVFWETTLLPKVQYLEDLLQSDLFTAERNADGIWGAFDLSTVEALREDLTEKTAVAKLMSELGYPLNAVNQRLELGMDDVKWGDAWWRNGTLVPQMDEPEDPQLQEEPDAQGSESDPAANDDNASEDPADDTEKAARAARTLRRGASIFNTEAHWESIVQRILGPGSDRFASCYRKFLGKLRAAQLSRVDGAGATNDSEALLFPLKEWQGVIAADSRPIYKKVYENAARDMEEELARLGKSVPKAETRATDERAQIFLTKMSRRIEKTVGTVRNRLKRQLDEAVEKGMTKDELKAVIRETFTGITTQGKVEVIASTEVSATTNGARVIVMQKAGVRKQEWLTAADERVRDTHVIYGEAGEQKLGFNFAKLSGGRYTLRYPLDPEAPPEECVNCRCVTVPVGDATDDDLDDVREDSAPRKPRRIRLMDDNDTVTVTLKVPRRLIK